MNQKGLHDTIFCSDQNALAVVELPLLSAIVSILLKEKLQVLE